MALAGSGDFGHAARRMPARDPLGAIRAALLFACAATLAAACSDGSLPSAPATVAFTVADDPDGPALLVTPETALHGASAYGVVVTSRVRDRAGRPIAASEAFARAAGIEPTRAPGAPVTDPTFALYADDPEDPGNPYPDARLIDGDGRLHVPDHIALRGVADDAETATAHRLLRSYADGVASLGGFSATAPVRIALSAPVDLATAGPDSVLFFEIPDDEGRPRAVDPPAISLAALLDAARSLGVTDEEVVLATWFPTLPIVDDLLSVQRVLSDRIGRDDVGFVDPDPGDDLPIGYFTRDEATFASYLAGAPSVAAVAVGLIAAPEFRGPEGTFVPERVRGEVPAPANELDFYLTLPAAGSPPYPVVLLQHGFGGSNQIVLELGPIFAEHGLATIGISAVSHGRRGSSLDLLTSGPFGIRDIFRQSIADEMSVLRAIEAGIDADGDGRPDLDGGRTSFIGISLGGILGATLVAVEESLPVAVLNVAGGRVAFLATSAGTRAIYLDSLAAQTGLAVGDPRFEAFVRRNLEIAQHVLDPVDPLNYAPHWFADPFPGQTPHRILLQEGIGDLLVDNSRTEELAAAGALVANQAMADPGGVSGLWRFEPPGGHSIFTREDVRAQAIRFLLSGGTEIVDPGDPSP
jgi:dienelactone hydrolase